MVQVLLQGVLPAQVAQDEHRAGALVAAPDRADRVRHLDLGAVGPGQAAPVDGSVAGVVADGDRFRHDRGGLAAKQVGDSAQQTKDRIAEATQDATKEASAGLNAATEKVGKKVEQAGEKIQESAKK